MKKNYIKPEIKQKTIMHSRMVCASPPHEMPDRTMDVSDDTRFNWEDVN